MYHRANHRGRLSSCLAARRGFTLVEMLVVIAIIGVLISLGSAAYFRFIGTSQQTTTESTINTVYKILEQQMRAVVDQADKEDIPASVQTMAGVIWKKLRLKQEFPINFTEAKSPSTGGTATSSLNPASDLPGKRAYQVALQSAVTGPGDSSACLLLALQQTRGGVRLKMDDLGTAVADTNGDGVKEIVDGWGNPLRFVRWPANNTAPWNTDLQNLNPAQVGPGSRFADPLDPQGRLMSPNWGNPGKNQFQNLCHQILQPGISPTRAWYMVPVLQSAGRDGQFDTADDVYSFYSVRLGAKGAKQ